jgi:transposase
MKDSLQPVKRRRYDAAFREEALHLASESRSTQAAARALNINAKLLYQWQKETLTPIAAARGAELDPATAAELRQLWALACFAYYNHRRPHQSPHGQTPAQVFNLTQTFKHINVYYHAPLNCPVFGE